MQRHFCMKPMLSYTIILTHFDIHALKFFQRYEVSVVFIIEPGTSMYAHVYKTNNITDIRTDLEFLGVCIKPNTLAFHMCKLNRIIKRKAKIPFWLQRLWCLLFGRTET